ncbi:hypothetical protein GCM10027521_56890 [Amycolatopsis cihanbeyliensis]
MWAEGGQAVMLYPGSSPSCLRTEKWGPPYSVAPTGNLRKSAYQQAPASRQTAQDPAAPGSAPVEYQVDSH